MNFEEAEILHDAAILSSKAHKFVYEEALANELAGHFYLESGRKNRSESITFLRRLRSTMNGVLSQRQTCLQNISVGEMSCCCDELSQGDSRLFARSDAEI